MARSMLAPSASQTNPSLADLPHARRRFQTRPAPHRARQECQQRIGQDGASSVRPATLAERGQIYRRSVVFRSVRRLWPANIFIPLPRFVYAGQRSFSHSVGQALECDCRRREIRRPGQCIAPWHRRSSCSDSKRPHRFTGLIGPPPAASSARELAGRTTYHPTPMWCWSAAP